MRDIEAKPWAKRSVPTDANDRVMLAWARRETAPLPILTYLYLVSPARAAPRWQ
jgi:hypothetical protein